MPRQSGWRPSGDTIEVTKMLDAQNTPALPAVTRREAYQPPDWHIPELALAFDLDPAETRVRATLSVMRAGAHDRPLRLDGAGTVALSATVAGVAINAWRPESETVGVPPHRRPPP